MTIDQYTVTIKPVQEPVAGEDIQLQAEPSVGTDVSFLWDVKGFGRLDRTDQQIVQWSTRNLPAGTYRVAVTAMWKIGGDRTITHTAEVPFELQGGAPAMAAMGSEPFHQERGPRGPISVRLQRADMRPTTDLALWVVIRRATEALSFSNYQRFIEIVLCGRPDPHGHYSKANGTFTDLSKLRFLPYTDSDAYRLLKVATEAFVMTNCAVELGSQVLTPSDADAVNLRLGSSLDDSQLNHFWHCYLREINGCEDATIPYLQLIREKLQDIPLMDDFGAGQAPSSGLGPAPSFRNAKNCVGIIRSKLTRPCLLELIWSYWHEEGMLAQSMNAIALRFQNIRSAGENDPLRMMEIAPLRPLNNLLWGWIQDEQHRLTLLRRTYEYSHHYDLTLYGKAVPQLRPADARSKFIEAFHNLLYVCSVFFRSDDDTTVSADGFPTLNALREVHLLLTEGMHNQFGDLPSTARIEMLMQQWILACPEFREFLPTRTMTALPEPWMDRVDAMKTLQRWTDTSILHFRNLGVFGEQLLLTIRFGNWVAVDDPAHAANWARLWRPQIQGYIHAYRAATGVDLTAEPSGNQRMEARSAQPWVHLKNRLETQSQRRV